MPHAELLPLTEQDLRRAADQLATLDPDLAPLVERFGAPPLWAREPGYATLVHIILEQQVSLKAAGTMFKRLDAALAGVAPTTVLQCGQNGLRALGLTRQKARYCHELARRVVDGELTLDNLHKRPEQEGRKALLAVPGLGPWSVDVYYLMALRQPDIWPQGDLALASALQDVKGLPAPPSREQQQELAAPWSPWRAVAARLLWAHYLAERGDHDMLNS